MTNMRTADYAAQLKDELTVYKSRIRRLEAGLAEIVNQWPHSEYCAYITRTDENRACNCFLHVARKALDGRP